MGAIFILKKSIYMKIMIRNIFMDIVIFVVVKNIFNYNSIKKIKYEYVLNKGVVYERE